MASGKPPSFVRKGTFLWDELGYRYSEEPPLNLLTKQALVSDDTWIALASALEHAKVGTFAPLTQLAKLVTSNSSPLLVRGIVELLGDAGPREALRALQALARDETEWLRGEACWGAQYAGSLWLVPSILETWQRAKRQSAREKISCVLSRLLEERAGPISDGAGTEALEYENLVSARLEELRAQFGSDKVPVWEGRIFGVTALAERKYRTLVAGDQTPSALSVQFTGFRHRFEASTGIDCSSFFSNRTFQRLAATALLEGFLESPEAAKYEDGVRYFFGHRIPD